MAGSYIDVKSAAGSFKAYVSVPESGKGPGLVLCQEIFGVNEVMRQKADFFAEEGYTVIVPDLFWRIQPNVELGYTEEDFQKAFDLYTKFDEDTGIEDIQSTINTLKNLETVNQEVGIGLVGYCLGGKLAYLAACRIPDLSCSVSYYGVGIDQNLDEAKNITSKLVLHFAEQDQFCDSTSREKIVSALKESTHVETYVYPGVDHAFARPQGMHFHKPSALMALQITVLTAFT